VLSRSRVVGVCGVKSEETRPDGAFAGDADRDVPALGARRSRRRRPAGSIVYIARTAFKSSLLDESASIDDFAARRSTTARARAEPERRRDEISSQTRRTRER